MAEKQKFNFLANARRPEESVRSAAAPSDPPAVPGGSLTEPVSGSAEDDTAPLPPVSIVNSQVRRLDQTRPADGQNFIFRFILREKLRENKKNDFDMTDIGKLENSILRCGLLQNILVIYSVEEDTYIIESGHRRTKALDNLIAKWEDYSGEPGSPEYDDYLLYLKNVAPYKKGYPCKVADTLGENMVYDSYTDEELPDALIDSEIRLIISNEEVRSIPPAVRQRDIARLDYLFSLKNRGVPKKERRNANKEIGSLLNISESQVKNYKAIGRLIPELQEEFEKNNITLKEGSNYSRLSAEEQQSILSLLRAGEKVSAAEIETLLKERNSLTREIEAQRRTIEELEQTASGSDHGTELTEKDTEIESLKKEIEKLREKEKSLAPKQTLTPLQAQLARQDMGIRAAYDTCRKDIRCLLSEMGSLKKLADSDPSVPSGLGILNEKDMENMLMELKGLLESGKEESYENT